jgi:hypothetical protein
MNVMAIGSALLRGPWSWLSSPTIYSSGLLEKRAMSSFPVGNPQITQFYARFNPHGNYYKLSRLPFALRGDSTRRESESLGTELVKLQVLLLQAAQILYYQ